MNHNYIPNLFFLLEAFAKNKTKKIAAIFIAMHFTLPKLEPKETKIHSRSPTPSVYTKSCTSEKLKDSLIKYP